MDSRFRGSDKIMRNIDYFKGLEDTWQARKSQNHFSALTMHPFRNLKKQNGINTENRAKIRHFVQIMPESENQFRL